MKKNDLHQKYPELAKFYFLGIGDNSGAYMCSMKTHVNFSQLCELARGVCRFKAPIHYSVTSGNTPYSVLSSGSTFLPLIHNDVFEGIACNGFTGWKLTGAYLENAQRNLAEEYSLLMVTGRSGPCDLTLSQEIDESESELVAVPGFSKKARGYIFDYDTWDGADFFVTGKSPLPIVTEQVVEFFKETEVTNVRFTNILDSEYFSRNQ